MEACRPLPCHLATAPTGTSLQSRVQGSTFKEVLSGKRDSNPRLRPWQGRTLPLSYSRPPSKSLYHTSWTIAIKVMLQTEDRGHSPADGWRTASHSSATRPRGLAGVEEAYGAIGLVGSQPCRMSRLEPAACARRGDAGPSPFDALEPVRAGHHQLVRVRVRGPADSRSTCRRPLVRNQIMGL